MTSDKHWECSPIIIRWYINLLDEVKETRCYISVIIRSSYIHEKEELVAVAVVVVVTVERHHCAIQPVDYYKRIILNSNLLTRILKYD